MLTSKDLAELLAETPPCEVSEIAKKTTGRGFQQFSASNEIANYAKLLPDDGLTSSQSSQASQHCELVAKPIPEPFLASSQTSQGDIADSIGQSEESEAMQLALHAIAQAALTDEQKKSRLAELRRKPLTAPFWAVFFEPTIPPSDDEPNTSNK